MSENERPVFVSDPRKGIMFIFGLFFNVVLLFLIFEAVNTGFYAAVEVIVAAEVLFFIAIYQLIPRVEFYQSFIKVGRGMMTSYIEYVDLNVELRRNYRGFPYCMLSRRGFNDPSWSVINGIPKETGQRVFDWLQAKGAHTVSRI